MTHPLDNIDDERRPGETDADVVKRVCEELKKKGIYGYYLDSYEELDPRIVKYLKEECGG